MSEHVEEEIAVTGSLFSFTLFEEKLMKNFIIISNKLRKLEGVLELEQRSKALEKEFKFLSMKVDTIVEKLPKDGGSVTRNDVKLMVKDQFIDLFNTADDKIAKTKYHTDILNEIAKLREELRNGGSHQNSNNRDMGGKDKKETSKTSFTAGQILRENEKDRDRNGPPVSKETLKEVLNDKEMEIVNGIIDEKNTQEEKTDNKVDNSLAIKVDELTKMVEELRLGRGYASFLQRQAQKFQKFEQFEQKSRQTTRKLKQKPIQLEGIKAENLKSQSLKNNLYTDLQRMQLNKQEIAKQELMQKKTMYSNLGVLGKEKETKDLREMKELRDIKELREGKDKKGLAQDSEGFKRSGSIKKLDRIERRLKVDDLKELNGVLREIELRIEGKVSHDIFMGFVKDFEEKLQVIRFGRDTGAEINELRKNIFVLQSKLQSVIAYLQSIAQEDEALLVKKQWTCVSCDKGLQKFQGKVGQHLNWDTVSAKKMSPTKVGAFGQTGQLAAKIRNLMDGNEGE